MNNITISSTNGNRSGEKCHLRIYKGHDRLVDLAVSQRHPRKHFATLTRSKFATRLELLLKDLVSRQFITHSERNYILAEVFPRIYAGQYGKLAQINQASDLFDSNINGWSVSRLTTSNGAVQLLVKRGNYFGKHHTFDCVEHFETWLDLLLECNNIGKHDSQRSLFAVIKAIDPSILSL